MRAEITFLSRMIFGIDKDCVVRTGGHAGFAANANRFIKVYDSVLSLEHRGSRTRRDTWRVGALIAARYLMRAPRLRKLADVHVLDVGARYRKRHHVFGLTGGRARMTADTARVVDDLRPLNLVSRLRHTSFRSGFDEGQLYHARALMKYENGSPGARGNCVLPGLECH